MSSSNDTRSRFEMLVFEFIGTGLLLLSGLSLVILMFGTGSPMARVLPSETVRRAVTGFIFGSFGALISISPVGKVSGAHLNPAVTLGFRLMGKLESGLGIGYVVAQLAGAVVGCLPLLAWGAMGRSISFAATLPGPGYSTPTVLMGEVLVTFGLVATLFVFIGTRRLRRFTPMAIPVLYAVMVPLEASISGTSTNPARSFGPALVSGQWQGWWIYWVGPLLGMLVALVACNTFLSRIEVAKMYHFESDHGGVFQRMRERQIARIRGRGARLSTSLRARVRALEADTYALYLAARDPRVPWPAKAVAAITVAYALSPIDLIPDFIPVIGYLDDLVLVPLGLALAIRLVPPSLLAEHRAEAARRFAGRGPRSRMGAVLVVVVWLLALAWLARVFWPRLHR